MAKVMPPEIEREADKVLGLLRTNTRWDVVTPEALSQLAGGDPAELGWQFTIFLVNKGHVMLGKPIVPINRPTLFDPVAFIEQEGWTLLGEETDVRSTDLKTLNISKVHLETMLKYDETTITGEQRLERLKKARHIRLDVGMFLVFLNNQDIIPESWKDNTENDAPCINFDGTILVSPHGERCVFGLYWLDNMWHWTVDWLGRECPGSASAVLYACKS